MSAEVEFKDCDTTKVFDDVSRNCDSDETRSLWNRLIQEMSAKKVDGAESYLAAEFQRLRENLEQELDRLEADQQ
jgi:hypothetical protein